MLILMFIMFLTGAARAGEPPSSKTLAHEEKIYSEGLYKSPKAAVPTKNAYQWGLTLDVRELSDPKVCVAYGFEGSPLNRVCGVSGGLKNKDGSPATESTVLYQGSKGLSPGKAYHAVMSITGAALKTSTNIYMWEIQ